MNRLIKLFLFVLFSASPVLAGTITVGNGTSYDYASIQDAINAANSGDYIDVSAGNYREDLTVSDKNLTITGSSLNRTAVVIEGSININKGVQVTIQYLVIEGNGKSYAVRTAGTADIKYGRIRNSRNGVYVLKSGYAKLYDQIISDINSYCVYSKNRGEIRIERSTIDNCSKAGVRVVKNRKRLYVTESTFSNNRNGIQMLNSKKRNFITKSKFDSNKVGIRFRRSKAYTSDNTFVNNSKNIVRHR